MSPGRVAGRVVPCHRGPVTERTHGDDDDLVDQVEIISPPGPFTTRTVVTFDQPLPPSALPGIRATFGAGSGSTVRTSRRSEPGPTPDPSPTVASSAPVRRTDVAELVAQAYRGTAVRILTVEVEVEVAAEVNGEDDVDVEPDTAPPGRWRAEFDAGEGSESVVIGTGAPTSLAVVAWRLVDAVQDVVFEGTLWGTSVPPCAVHRHHPALCTVENEQLRLECPDGAWSTTLT